MQSLRKYALPLVQGLLLLAVVYYLYQNVVANWHEVKEYRPSFEPVSLAIAVSWFVLSNFLMGYGLLRLFREFGFPVSYFRCFLTWVLSLPMKYVPIKVGIVTGRLALHHQWGTPRASTVAAYLMEGFYLLFTGLALGITAAGIWSPEFNRPLLLAGIGLFLAGFAVFHPLALHNILSRAMRRFGNIDAAPKIKLGNAAFLYVYYLMVWCVQGLSTSFFATSLFPEEPMGFLQGLSVYALSLLGGALAILPGGWGFQEGIAQFLIERCYENPQAVAVLPFALRLYMVVGELVFFLIGVGLYLWKEGQLPTKDDFQRQLKGISSADAAGT